MTINGVCARSGGCPYDCGDQTCFVPKSLAGPFTPGMDLPRQWDDRFCPSYRSQAQVDAEAAVLSGEEWKEPAAPLTHLVHDSVIIEMQPSSLDEQVLQAIEAKLEAQRGPWLDGSEGLTPDEAWTALLDFTSLSPPTKDKT